MDETERFLETVQGATAFALAEIPCLGGEPVSVRLVRRKDGSGFALTLRRGDKGLLSDYWPSYEHGSWSVSDLTDKDGRVTNIMGLSPERVARYLQEDAKKQGVAVDHQALADVISDERMRQVTVLCDVLCS